MASKEKIQEAVSLQDLREKREPSLGEFSPLLYPPNLGDPQTTDALAMVINRDIERAGGVQPEMIATSMAYPEFGPPEPRLVVRYRTDELTDKQLAQIEEVVSVIYGTKIIGRKDTHGKPIKPTPYPTIETRRKTSKNQEESKRMLGWYMGTNTSPVSGFHEGLFVHRDLGSGAMGNYLQDKAASEWFLNPKIVQPESGTQIPSEYMIEMRVASMYQTEVVMMANYLSMVLSKQPLPKYDELLYKVFNNLNRLGVKKPMAVTGLDEKKEAVKRGLITPLANHEMSRAISLKPSSILLVGVPGTGKTLLAEELLHEDLGLLVVPVDALQLAQDMSQPVSRRRILPRVAQVFERTGLPVILHIDDLELLANENNSTNSTLLNLMAGVRESGFYVIGSTNHPDRLNPQLLQPERFGYVFYFDLPDQKTRKDILDIHATRVSREMGIELFESEEQRQHVVQGLASVTEGYTARYLAQICNEAKAFFMERVVGSAKIQSRLKEKDLKGHHFSVDDWGKGLQVTSDKFDKESIKDWDRRIRQFVESTGKDLGFVTEKDVKAIEHAFYQAYNAAARLSISGEDE